MVEHIGLITKYLKFVTYHSIITQLYMNCFG